ncbi:SDR family NAD(P)-dependent oxidoreductase [Saccharopolyspora indica]|uniref:SDR family NAD(P)-dependent oxidoreductase n=2 Tax=Saccharopolyspora indica TaxID=1229659 RepID=UPI0038CD74CC
MRRVTADLQATRERLRQAEEADGEPIAIIGMACRFPGGVRSPEDLWRLVSEGTDAIGPFPADRGWDLAALAAPTGPGRSVTQEGGFLDGAADFDAEFFGISPREALAMDPQHRLLLETSWEAFERAGIDPRSARGSRTGVFLGTNGRDYPELLRNAPDAVEGHAGIGNASSVLSGRVAYALGLEGPALSVDTACSSSLVALHLACQSLRRGESTTALAGGATVMATPGTFVEFTRQQGLAPDGRCKAFADAADGTGWGEGVGVVVLERLSVARGLGRRVLGVVRGSAVNSDGASNGLTAPSGPSQERVVRRALVVSGVSAGSVDVVEGHGTGTVLGDPIEVQALQRVYGRGRSRDVLLGSVKSNVGHAQAAAGVAGVMKMVLAMRWGVVPASLHVGGVSSRVEWSGGGVEVVDRAREWPVVVGRPRRAGVSSFGVSGTNAHVILEAAEEPEIHESAVDGLVPWVISARTPEALREQAARLCEHAPRAAVDVAHTLHTGRAALEHRAVVVGADRATMLEGLRAVAEGAPAPQVVHGKARTTGKTVFVFPGQGSQWVGMGVDLLGSSPVFAERFAECSEALERFVEWSPRAMLGDESGLLRVDVVQPLLWAVMVSLAAVWESFGVKPDAVVGHSQGEIAAAVVSGALSVEDGARIVALRSSALKALAGRGGMVSIAESADRVRERISQWGERVSVAAVNGPAVTVVAGEPAALEELIEACEAEDVRARRIPVDYASHSAQVESLQDELLAVLEPVRPVAGRVPLLSTVSGVETDGSDLDGKYWFRNLREPVEFEQAVSRLVGSGCGLFVECSPHPVLTLGVQQTAEDAVVVGTLRRDAGGMDRVLLSAAEVHVAGARVDFSPLFQGGRLVDLPTYPFQRERFWPTVRPAVGDLDAGGLDPAGHPLLGAVVERADGGVVLTGRLGLDTHPWLADHVVRGTALLPAGAFVDLAVHAGDLVGCDQVDELTLEAPLAVPDHGGARLHVTVGGPDASGTRSVAVHSRNDSGWTRHATGTLSAAESDVDAQGGQWPPGGAVPVDLDGWWDHLAALGVDYGPAFRCLRAVWRHGDDLYAEAALPDPAAAEGFGVHPALLDAASQATALLADDRTARMPFSWTGFRLHGTGATSVRIRVSPRGADTVSLSITDPAGAPVATVGSLVSRPAPAAGVARAGGLYTLDWIDFPGGLGGGQPAGEVVHLRCDPAPDDPRAPLGRVLDALRDALSSDDGLLVVRTRGAVATDDPDPAGAAVWGLVRSAQREHPGRIVLVDVDDDPASERALTAAIGTGEPQLALRAGRALVPRLTAVPADGSAVEFPRDGTVLVTGAPAGLGGLVARHLVTAHDVAHVLFVSRRGADAPGADRLRDDLTAAGAAITIAACDAADRDAMAALLAGIPAERPLRAVVHTAAVLADGVVTAVTDADLDRVLRAKADAAQVLDELTADADLAEFVLFSSASGTLGGPGMAAYAAANAHLDAFAAARRSRGLPARSLAWGLWADTGGIAGRLASTAVDRMVRAGVAALSEQDGLALFDAALACEAPAVLPMRLDVAALRAGGPELAPLLAGLVRPQVRRAAVGGSDDGRPPADLAEPGALLDLVRGHVATVLGHGSARKVPEDRPLRELGFDSLTAVELRNRLVAATGLRLPPTLAFDHPSAAALAAHLRAALFGDEVDGAAALFDHLDRLAADLAATALSQDERADVAARMRALLAEWAGEPGDPGDGGLPAGDDDELFAYIDSKLGPA